MKEKQKAFFVNKTTHTHNSTGDLQSLEFVLSHEAFSFKRIFQYVRIQPVAKA